MNNKFILTILLIGIQTATAHARTNINVNIGAPPVVVESQPPAPLAVPPPPTVTAPPQVIFQTTPRFIFSPTLGFYVAVETPYDIAFLDGRYYLWSGGFWYVAPYYNGPWVVVRGKHLPPTLRRFRHTEIRRHRDAEYRVFQRDREHYHGRWHEPGERR